MNDNNSVGIFTLLQVAFIVLKLCHLIDWPWFWVLTPIWLGIALFILFMIILAIIDHMS